MSRDPAPMTLEQRLGANLSRWVAGLCRHSWRTIAAIAALTVCLGTYAALNLGGSSRARDMASGDLAARRIHDRYTALFPNLEDALLLVVEGVNTEQTRDGADALRAALRQRPDLCSGAYLPGSGEFYERNGLLYRSVEELDGFADEMATIQPFIAEIERDASLVRLVSLVKEGLDQARERGDAEQWEAIVEQIGNATVAVFEEGPVHISWEEILLGETALDATRRIMIVDPVIEYDSLLGASASIAGIRELAETLGFNDSSGLRLRVTGNPALLLEELIGLAWDVFGAAVFCFAAVALVLYRALRSLRIVVAEVITLLVGLVWCSAWATLSVGYINNITMSFAILFIGLGVDFGIHLGMAFVDRLNRLRTPEEGFRQAVREIGGSLALCALTTSIGFLVFVPTSYRGLSEMGMIAGPSMLIVLVLTLTLFPALLCGALRVEADNEAPSTVRFQRDWNAIFRPHTKAICAIAAAAAMASVLLVPRARFDPNVASMRDASHESVQVFEDLVRETGLESPWFANSVASDLAAAEALARRIEVLEVVSDTLHLGDFVPDEQAEKLSILEDVAMLLDVPAAAPGSGDPPATVAEQIDALRELHAYLAENWNDPRFGVASDGLRRLRDDLATYLQRVESDPNPQEALRELEELLLSGLPAQLGRLRLALQAEPISLDTLPPELVERMLAKDGQARLQIFPRYSMLDDDAFRSFVDSVRSIDPLATGVAVNLVEFGREAMRAFRQALISAVLVIAALLWLLWRRASDMALTMVPLLLSALLTVATMVLIGMPFNYTNVIVIPLLFGVGVDSGIHLVHRSRNAESATEHLLETTTARAVYFSALTTIVSFGSLILSGHRGMQTFGLMLMIGMIASVLCNLILLPALLQLRRVEKPLTPQ